MSAEDRARWDKFYLERVGQSYPPPDPLLFEFTPPVAPGEEMRALDLAGGLGQNALWLASQGYIVDLVDASRVALNRARREMAARKLRSINVLQIDIDELEVEPERYDLVCVFRYLRRDLFPHINSAVAPGGRVIYETYNLKYLDRVPGFNVDFLLLANELLDAFTDWQVLLHEEDDHITRFVAVKPEAQPTGDEW
jgi:tellurite methyltransferase